MADKDYGRTRNGKLITEELVGELAEKAEDREIVRFPASASLPFSGEHFRMFTGGGGINLAIGGGDIREIAIGKVHENGFAQLPDSAGFAGAVEGRVEADAFLHE